MVEQAAERVATTHVACLCAAWCRLCDDYRAVQEQVAREFADAGVALHWHWVDIEDEAELLGEVDVETFPTLVVAAADTVRFAGPVLPHADVLRRMLRACTVEAEAGTRWPVVDAATLKFAERLLKRPDDSPG